MSNYNWSAPSRPPYVLAFAADMSGCGHHRVSMPLAYLVRAGIFEGRIDTTRWPAEALRACAPDIIVFQRQIEKHQLDTMQWMRDLLPNCFMVYEIDDLLSEVPERNFHASAMPPDIDGQIRKAMQIVDATTVTTPLLKEWMDSLGSKRTTIIPNLMAQEQVQRRENRPDKHKVRIGWGGGMSHGGDLELIKPAMAELGDSVTWVFQGFRPEGDVPVEIEYHDPCTPSEYTERLRSLNIDLFIAPLEQNRFNNAKSNLRIIESGACNGAVIAQRVDSYLEDKPPVFAYCDTAEDWTREIKNFLKLSPSSMRHRGDRMRAWVNDKYTFERRMEERARAWMPEGAKLWQPNASQQREHEIVVVQDAGLLEEECVRARGAGNHVLWARPGVVVDDLLKRRLLLGIRNGQVMASVPLSPDGVNAFPDKTKFHPIDADVSRIIDKVVQTECAGLQLKLPIAFGPCMLLRHEVLNVLGAPDVGGFGGNIDGALMEWTARGAVRGLHCVQMADAYAGTVFAPLPATESNQYRMQTRGSIDAARMPGEELPPERREAVEIAFFREKWDGLRPNMSGFRDDYATHSSLRRPYVRKYTGELCVQATDVGDTTEDKSKWTLWIPPFMEIAPDALFRVHDFIIDNPTAEIIYGDHEMLSAELHRIPMYKPDLDIHYFFTFDYVSQALVTMGIAEFPTCNDMYEYVLDHYASRCGPFSVHDAKPDDTKPHNIAHLPEILTIGTDVRDKDERFAYYTERTEERCEIVQNYVGELNAKVEPHPQLKVMGYSQVVHIPNTNEHIAIIIPTLGDPWKLHPCINSIVQHTEDVSYEVLIVDTTPEFIVDIGDNARASGKFTVIHEHREKFNWSVVNNRAVAAGAFKTEPSAYLFLNDDTMPLRKDWLSNMVGHIGQHRVGIVGARMLYPNQAVQHIGMTVHKGSIAFTMKGLSASLMGYMGLAAMAHEVMAVTGACMLVDAMLFDELGGFDEQFVENYADVDFCLRARAKGTLTVVETQSELHHREFGTRAMPDTAQSIDTMLRDGHLIAPHITEPDPYWNHHFNLRSSGVMVTGGGYDSLAWPENSPQPGAKRVLMVNDKVDGAGGIFNSNGIERQRKGEMVFMADLSGFEMIMIAPTFATPVAWDIRYHVKLGQKLRAMGIDEIVLCSLVGGRSASSTVEALRALRSVGIPLLYQGTDAEAICPRRNFLVKGVDCGEGFKKGAGHCQVCVDENGSPFGLVDIPAYWNAWQAVIEGEQQADAAD